MSRREPLQTGIPNKSVYKHSADSNERKVIRQRINKRCGEPTFNKIMLIELNTSPHTLIISYCSLFLLFLVWFLVFAVNRFRPEFSPVVHRCLYQTCWVGSLDSRSLSNGFSINYNCYVTVTCTRLWKREWQAYKTNQVCLMIDSIVTRAWRNHDIISQS